LLKYSNFLFFNASNKKRNPIQTTKRLVNKDEETRNAGNKQIKIVAKK
tara:strand:+ start:225 stop:368 length:144 start_codon:yes stop_codon:yes gene_type:complete